MNDHNCKDFEADLQRVKPAEPPPAFMARLTAAVQTSAVASREKPIRGTSPWWDSLLPWLRWFAPAAAAAVVALMVWRGPRSATTPEVASAPTPAGSLLKPDDVQFDRRLVGAFDALAQLPSGETVRFRCHEWTDQMTLRDAARGIEVVQNTPSFEVLPVRFETY